MALDRSDSRRVGKQSGSAESVYLGYLGSERSGCPDRARRAHLARRCGVIAAAQSSARFGDVDTVNTIEHNFDNAGQLAGALAAAIASDLKSAIAARGHALLAVSGGRTPALFFAQLSQQSLAWDHVTVTLVDERWVAPSDARSNEGMVRATLLQGAAAAARFVPLYQAGVA